MGDFRITINAVGGHGQDRSKKDGETVDFNAGGEGTPDSVAKKCVDELKAKGVDVTSATITHWPGSETEVTDDLLTGARKGNF
jgi:hypothetical protein